MSRAIYGRIYELNLRNPDPDEEHPYVGMTTERTLHERVHGRGGHTSPEEVAKNPWKARILPGRAGYRLLETVYDTGDPVENDRLLRRAESYWIDRLRAKYNKVRPIRPFGDPLPARPRAARPIVVMTPAQRRRRRSRRLRVASCLMLMATVTMFAARVVAAMELPWPAAPWIASPVIGIVVGWLVFWRMHRAVRKLVR